MLQLLRIFCQRLLYLHWLYELRRWIIIPVSVCALSCSYTHTHKYTQTDKFVSLLLRDLLPTFPPACIFSHIVLISVITSSLPSAPGSKADATTSLRQTPDKGGSPERVNVHIMLPRVVGNQMFHQTWWNSTSCHIKIQVLTVTLKYWASDCYHLSVLLSWYIVHWVRWAVLSSRWLQPWSSHLLVALPTHKCPVDKPGNQRCTPFLRLQNLKRMNNVLKTWVQWP